MSHFVLISSDADVLARWSTAFADAQAFATIEHAAHNIGAATIVWLHLPQAPGEAAQQVKLAAQRLSPARLVALSDTPSDEQALELMDLGAAGYCHSHAGAAMLQQVATVVGNQGLWVGQNLLGRLIRAALAANSPVVSPGNVTLATLSSREREVAQAVAAGASNKEIARQLRITERTVKAHISSIFMKLGVRDRLHLAIVIRNVSASTPVPRHD